MWSLPLCWWENRLRRKASSCPTSRKRRSWKKKSFKLRPLPTCKNQTKQNIGNSCCQFDGQLYVELCDCSEASESSSLLWKKKMHFWPKCYLSSSRIKNCEDWVSLSLKWFNNQKEIHTSPERNSSSDRVHPGPDCTPGVYALILARSEAGEDLSFPTLSRGSWKLQVWSITLHPIKLVNSCKKECSLDCNKFFLSIFLWLGNRWQFIIEEQGMGTWKKSIKLNIYVFPTPGHMSERFKND